MKQRYTIYALFLLSLFVSISASAQIKGVITDSLTNEPLMYITVQYEGKGVGGISNANGEYQVETRKGWDELTFSAVGYITKKVKLKPGTRVLNVKLQSDDIMLSEVVVKPKKEKYSRKNNPAVEFMKKVIENKKALKLEENDYYQYQKYEKMKMSLNDVTPDKMEKGIYKKFSFFKDQVEVSPKTNKMILPISIKETASKTIFRKNPKSEDHHRRYELHRYRRVLQHRRHAGDHPYGRILRHQHLRRRHPAAATPLRQPHRPRSYQLLQILLDGHAHGG